MEVKRWETSSGKRDRAAAPQTLALQRPQGFPDRYWLPVLAAEAAARAVLFAGLAEVAWKYGGPKRFLNWNAVRALTAAYVIAVVDAFAGQACLAVRAREFPAVHLDQTVQQFVDLAIRQAYLGLEDEKIQATWRGIGQFGGIDRELHPIIRRAEWHMRYLAELPSVLQAALTASSPVPSSPEAKAQRRGAIISPLLAAKGWSTSQWATAAGVAQAVAYDYMNGKSDPRPESRKALAEALTLQTADLPN